MGGRKEAEDDPSDIQQRTDGAGKDRNQGGNEGSKGGEEDDFRPVIRGGRGKEEG